MKVWVKFGRTAGFKKNEGRRKGLCPAEVMEYQRAGETGVSEVTG